MDPYSINDDKWLSNLLSEYEKHLWRLEDNLLSLEKDLVTITGLEFCGCAQCYSREQLAFMIPRIVRAFLAGTIQLH